MKLSDKAVKVLTTFIDVADKHAQGGRGGINVHTEELNALVGGPKVAFRDEIVLRECAQWCEENDLPLLTMMMSADPHGEYPDEVSSNLAFKFGIVPSRAERKKAWIAEREEIAALDVDAIEAAKEALDEVVQSMGAAKAPSSRRALANARNQEIEAKSLEEWLAQYQGVLDVAAPGQPLVHNGFMESQEGYKERAWERWRKELSFDEWVEDGIGAGEIVSKLQQTLDDGDANWITKRYGGFDLASKLAEKVHGIEDFERAAYGFYVGDLAAKEFFKKAVALLGRQYSVVSHLMFLKDKDAYVPVKPDAFEAGLRKLGVEFYLSGFCSWDNYTRFLGYLERIRQMLLEIDSGTTLLDAHSILWIIGSGYWFDGGGAELVAQMRENV